MTQPGEDDRPDPDDPRRETPTEQLDRQFQDLLQELRVSQAGVQILFAFLLGIAFTPVFGDIADWQRDVYVATLIMTVLATVSFIDPVSDARQARLTGMITLTGGSRTLLVLQHVQSTGTAS